MFSDHDETSPSNAAVSAPSPACIMQVLSVGMTVQRGSLSAADHIGI